MISLSKHFNKLIIPLFLFFFCLYQLNSLTQSYWISSHDGVFHALRIKEYYYELTVGHFPPRWTSRLDNNYGIPLFNYIYPLPYLAGSIPMFFGSNERDAYKIVLFTGYLVGVLGFYFLFKNKNKSIALICAMLYGTTPYLFLNIFVRGALGEVVAMGLMPWVLYAFQSNKKYLSIISLFLLLISHNFLGPLFLIFLIVYLVWNRHFNLHSLLRIIFSLALAAFFLIPMIFEKQYIVSGANNNFTFDYREHFVYFKQLIYGKWDYWYSNPGPSDGVSFQLGFANLFIILLSALYIFVNKQVRALIFLLIITLFTLFLTLTYSQPLWQLIKPLQIIQFPWRFFFLTTLLFPLMFSLLFSDLKNKHFIFKSKIIPLFLLFLALYNTRNYRRPMEFQGPEKYQQWLDIYDHKTTTASRDEISPRWTLKEKFSGGAVITSNQNAKILVEPDQSKNISFTLSGSATPSAVTILKNYYPALNLIDSSSGLSVKISPDEIGNIKTIIPDGSYQLSYLGTKLQHISNSISLFTLLLLLISSIKPIRKIL